MTKARCEGCHDDFYNNKNPMGVQECWSFKTARLVMKKEVSIDQAPPWKQKASLLPSCFHRPRFVYVGAKQER